MNNLKSDIEHNRIEYGFTETDMSKREMRNELEMKN